MLPLGTLILHLLNFVVSFALISVLFGAIYKVLPDAELSWRDVLIGAIVTALLFNLGKFLIGLYMAHSALASSYGAAGADFSAGRRIYQDLRRPSRHAGRYPRGFAIGEC